MVESLAMGARIIVADDSPEIASFLSEHLTMMGHEVTVVHDGAKLLLAAAKAPPHLIITDIQMPGGFGSTAYLALQKDAKTKDIPVIFVSAHPVESFIPEAPSTRYVQKPLDLKKFTRFVDELLPLGGYRP